MIVLSIETFSSKYPKLMVYYISLFKTSDWGQNTPIQLSEKHERWCLGYCAAVS